jgi:hypothetical protein
LQRPTTPEVLADLAFRAFTPSLIVVETGVPEKQSPSLIGDFKTTVIEMWSDFDKQPLTLANGFPTYL